MNLSNEIRQRVSMRDALEKYGFTTTRGGFLRCPFHTGDHTASLKVYPGDKGWHCYGCGKGGSVIDFVMELFHLDFRQAVVRIDSDFNLGLTGCKPDLRETARIRREQSELRMREQALDREYQALWGRYALLDRFLSTHLPTEESGGAFGALMAERERIWFRIEEMQIQMERG